jgi:hypothetical protein
MLILEKFSGRTIANMDAALESACRMMPDVFASHAARKFIAEQIVCCAETKTRTLDGLTDVGRQAAAELASGMGQATFAVDGRPGSSSSRRGV